MTHEAVKSLLPESGKLLLVNNNRKYMHKVIANHLVSPIKHENLYEQNISTFFTAILIFQPNGYSYRY